MVELIRVQYLAGGYPPSAHMIIAGHIRLRGFTAYATIQLRLLIVFLICECSTADGRFKFGPSYKMWMARPAIGTK